MAASWTTGHGNSSRSSHSWATGRMTFSAKSWTHFWICCWSSLSSSEKSVMAAKLPTGNRPGQPPPWPLPSLGVHGHAGSPHAQRARGHGVLVDQPGVGPAPPAGSTSSAPPTTTADDPDDAHHLGPARRPWRPWMRPSEPASRPRRRPRREAATPLDSRHCLLPYPDDRFTVADATTSTGPRVAFPPSGMPVNAQGAPIDPSEWNRNDGFSPNSTLLTYVAGLDGKVGLPPWTDLGCLDGTGLDRGPRRHDHGRAHPAVGRARRARPSRHGPPPHHPSGHRAAGRAPLRGGAARAARSATARPSRPAPVFRAYRDRLDTGLPDLEARRPRDGGHLRRARRERHRPPATSSSRGTSRPPASAASSERMLHIRDEALAALGAAAPAFTVTGVSEHPNDARRPPGHRHLHRAELPDRRRRTWPAVQPRPAMACPHATVTCRPRSSATSPPSRSPARTGPARIAEYGHGLLGGGDRGRRRRRAEHGPRAQHRVLRHQVGRV